MHRCLEHPLHMWLVWRGTNVKHHGMLVIIPLKAVSVCIRWPVIWYHRLLFRHWGCCCIMQGTVRWWYEQLWLHVSMFRFSCSRLAYDGAICRGLMLWCMCAIYVDTLVICSVYMIMLIWRFPPTHPLVDARVSEQEQVLGIFKADLRFTWRSIP